MKMLFKNFMTAFVCLTLLSTTAYGTELDQDHIDAAQWFESMPDYDKEGVNRRIGGMVEFWEQRDKPAIKILGMTDKDLSATLKTKIEISLEATEYLTVDYLKSKHGLLMTHTRLTNTVVFQNWARSETLGSAIVEAMNTGDPEIFASLLKNNSISLDEVFHFREIDIQPKTGVTLLLAAIELSQKPIVQYLLDHGSDPNQTDIHARGTPIYRAAAKNDIELVQLLLDAGASLEKVGHLPTALHAAVEVDSLEMLEMLLEAGSNPSDPMSLVIRKERKDMRKLLIAHGATPGPPDQWHWTPLMHALLKKDSELALDLIPYSDVIAISAKPRPPQYIKRPGTQIGFYLHADREYPTTNALYIAQDQAVPELIKIEESLFQRAEEQDAKWGKVLLSLAANKAAADVAIVENHLEEATNLLEIEVAKIDLDAIDNTMPGDLLTTTMQVLANLHELKVIQGKSFSDLDRAKVQQITNLGGWNQPWHDLLDTMAVASDGYPEEKLHTWQATHGHPRNLLYSFERLNHWIESVDDEKIQSRLFDTLDFFELH